MNDRDRTPAVVGVAVIRPHVMRLLFDDGVVRDLQYVHGQARGSLLLPLADPAYFAQVRVDDEARTVVWPNRLDLAPEVLHGATSPITGWASTTLRTPVSLSDIRRRRRRRTLPAGHHPVPACRDGHPLDPAAVPTTPGGVLERYRPCIRRWAVGPPDVNLHILVAPVPCKIDRDLQIW